MEAVEAGRAVMAIRLERGQARLAHRMLGDERGAFGRDLRHPWRRHRSRLSPPRKRDRAVGERASRTPARRRVDAQWLPASRRREDVEEPGEFRDDTRTTR